MDQQRPPSQRASCRRPCPRTRCPEHALVATLPGRASVCSTGMTAPMLSDIESIQPFPAALAPKSDAVCSAHGWKACRLTPGCRGCTSRTFGHPRAVQEGLPPLAQDPGQGSTAPQRGGYCPARLTTGHGGGHLVEAHPPAASRCARHLLVIRPSGSAHLNDPSRSLPLLPDPTCMGGFPSDGRGAPSSHSAVEKHRGPASAPEYRVSGRWAMRPLHTRRRSVQQDAEVPGAWALVTARDDAARIGRQLSGEATSQQSAGLPGSPLRTGYGRSGSSAMCLGDGFPGRRRRCAA